MSNMFFILELVFVLHYLWGAAHSCDEDTMDKSVRNFIRFHYRSQVQRTLQLTEIDPDNIDLFKSCQAWDPISNSLKAVVSFNIPEDYSTNSGDQGFTGRLDVTCRSSGWHCSPSNSRPLLRGFEGVCTDCISSKTDPCQACLLTCESNEIPLPDCSGCQKEKVVTRVVTHSVPKWKRTVTEEPTSGHTTQVIGSTVVITHGGNNPDESTGEPQATTPARSKRPRKYSTQTVQSTPDKGGFTTRGVHSTPRPHATTDQNYVSTKMVEPTTQHVVPDTQPVVPNTTGTVTVNNVTTRSTTNSSELVSTIQQNVTSPQTLDDKTTNSTVEGSAVVFTTMSPGVINTTSIRQINDTTTNSTTEEGESLTAKPVSVTDKEPTQGKPTENKQTEEQQTVENPTEVKTTEKSLTFPVIPSNGDNEIPEDNEVVNEESQSKEVENKDENDETDAQDGSGDATDDNGDQDVYIVDENDETEDDNAVESGETAEDMCSSESETCFNGGEEVCENGALLHCICTPEFLGDHCETERTVAKQDKPRGSGNFWDWKLSKYIIGGLGFLTLVGLVMLTCMIVKCVKSSKSERRQPGYSEVGMETFLPPAPVVVPGLLQTTALDRGSSDIMDERSEEEFPLHDSEDDEITDVMVHQPLPYPDPEDDGLLLHHAPSHRPKPSPEHYKVPANKVPANKATDGREYMNMAPKQNGTGAMAYMNGNANTYSHKLNSGKDQYHHLNRSYSRNGVKTHDYHNLP